MSKMLKFLIIAVLVYNSPAFGFQEYLDYALWPRGTPGEAEGIDKPECIKDILILWDNSFSIGKGFSTVKKFVKAFVKSDRLKVGEDGTHIGIISFADLEKTSVLWNVNDFTNRERLLEKIEKLKYGDPGGKGVKKGELAGDATRTGYALKKANELFSKKSPGNFRPTVGDVILLFTDGAPKRNRRVEQPFNKDLFDKLKDEFKSEVAMADHYAKELKEKNVLIVGFAAGHQGKNKDFYSNIQRWSTSSETAFSTTFNEKNMADILDKIVAAAGKCTDVSPVYCYCDQKKHDVNVEGYAKDGEDSAVVTWAKPTVSCTGDKPVDVKLKVDPEDAKSGTKRYKIGTHYVKYIHTFKNEKDEEEQRVCSAKITISKCKCPVRKLINIKIPTGRSSVKVSWKKPKPDCRTDKNAMENLEDSFTAGQESKEYSYSVGKGPNSVLIKCKVVINVTGDLCKDKAIDSSSQECCCGKAYFKKPNHACCGLEYYDQTISQCCDASRAIVVSSEKTCPVPIVA